MTLCLVLMCRSVLFSSAVQLTRKRLSTSSTERRRSSTSSIGSAAARSARRVSMESLPDSDASLSVAVGNAARNAARRRSLKQGAAEDAPSQSKPPQSKVRLLVRLRLALRVHSAHSTLAALCL